MDGGTVTIGSVAWSHGSCGLVADVSQMQLHRKVLLTYRRLDFTFHCQIPAELLYLLHKDLCSKS